MAEGSGTASSRPRLRDRIGDPGRFATVAELVPWRGSLADNAGDHARSLAARLRADGRVDAVSVTDGAGGHATLSPEVVASDLLDQGDQVIVHVACRDRNRNELLSLGWRLASAGIENVLAVTGDYPQEGPFGLARPVFDIDSVGLLELYSALSSGAIAGDVVSRRVRRDRVRDFPPLTLARWCTPPAPADFYLGTVVNPYKRVECDLLPQYLKLELKARAGARYAISQVGFDARRLDELIRYVTDHSLRLDLLAGVLVLSARMARILHAGAGIPGVTVTGELLDCAERQARSADKGRAFFLELAAKQVAVARGLGYAGAYLSGMARGDDYLRVLDLADTFGADDWQGFTGDVTWSPPDAYWLYEADPATGLNSSQPTAAGKAGRAPVRYRLSRLAHRIAFTPGTRGFRAAAGVLRSGERVGLGHALHVAEQAAKIPLYGCRDCGDCSLPEIAYLCPESRCLKNQRNGPCGGSRDGECEIPGRPCIWASAYQRLRPYGEELAMLRRPPTVQDNALRRTSGWANYFLGRDHAARPGPRATAPHTRPPGTAGPGQTARAANPTGSMPEERAP
jgi:methylenetetrahydrofolate reductase (NADPH)